MLRYNFQRLFVKRGITRPIPFLMRSGFTRASASRIVTGRTRGISPRQLELLCNAFKCTPNDLMEWTPDKPEQLNESNRLISLIRNETVNFNFGAFTSEMPLDMLPEFVKRAEEIKQEILTKAKIS